MARRPHDDPRSLAAFYGNPASGEPGRQLVPVGPPFRMTCDGKPIKAIQFHKKAASALLAALNEIWEHYGRDQARIDAAGVSRYAGAYNPRLIRGRATRWSNHAYARRSTSTPSRLASIPATAPCRRRWSTHSSVRARYGGDGRTDPMHFEFWRASGCLFGRSRRRRTADQRRPRQCSALGASSPTGAWLL